MHTPIRMLAAGLAAASLAFAPLASAQQKIKIGFITTLSGPAGVIGKHMKDSVELALDHLGNKMGGVPVEVIFGDDQFKPDVGVQVAEEMLKKHQVDIMSGIIWSHVMMAVVPVVTGSGKVMVGTNAGATYVASLGLTGTPGTFAYRGAGCPGSDGRQPRIELSGRAALGDSYTVAVRGALPNTIAAMNYGLQWDLPLTGLATGCIAHAYPLGLRTVAMNGNGMASTVPFTQIPVVTAFIGVEIHHQWYVVDPTNNFIGISTSNDGVVTIGQQ